MNSSQIKKLRQRNAVAILKKDGFSITAISKEIGVSYKHAKQLYEQTEVDSVVIAHNEELTGLGHDAY